MKFSFNKRKLKYGSISSLFIIFFVAVLILVNVLAGYLTDRFSLKLDLTSTGAYSLTDQTKECLSALEDDVTIYILSTRAAMEKNQTANSILETIQRYNTASGGKVKYEFIDPNKNPAFFTKYEKAKNAQARALVIDAPKRYTVVSSDEFAYTYGETDSKVYYESEEKLTAAILYVTSKEVSGAALTTGHGESEPAMLKTILNGNNFNTQTVDLVGGEIPPEVNNLVICAPKVDFSAEEVAKLDAFLKTPGNNLYVFWSVETPTLDVLERYLTEWGFAFEPYVVCDEKNSYMSEVYVIPELVKTDIITFDDPGQLGVISPRTRPINILWTARNSTAVTEFLRTQDSSYAKHLSADAPIKSLSRESGDVAGPFTAGALAQRQLSTSADSGVSSVFVFGSDALASEDTAQISRAFNNTMFTNLIDFANPNTDTLQIAPKVVQNYDLNITEGGVSILQILLIYIIPLAIILAGVLVFVRRRNR